MQTTRGEERTGAGVGLRTVPYIPDRRKGSFRGAESTGTASIVFSDEEQFLE